VSGAAGRGLNPLELASVLLVSMVLVSVVLVSRRAGAEPIKM
jgi:hypothetical protein